MEREGLFCRLRRSIEGQRKAVDYYCVVFRKPSRTSARGPIKWELNRCCASSLEGPDSLSSRRLLSCKQGQDLHQKTKASLVFKCFPFSECLWHKLFFWPGFLTQSWVWGESLETLLLSNAWIDNNWIIILSIMTSHRITNLIKRL